ncbi:hypothetical protein ACFYZE_35045 [Streptomyces sp. NPDC001796]|uniref:hypothetical protein n=1 Tax=Streptomyces sp. NPDC001796 TaxID=3364609 RepID=UPI0036AD93E6
MEAAPGHSEHVRHFLFHLLDRGQVRQLRDISRAAPAGLGDDTEQCLALRPARPGESHATPRRSSLRQHRVIAVAHRKAEGSAARSRDRP